MRRRASLLILVCCLGSPEVFPGARAEEKLPPNPATLRTRLTLDPEPSQEFQGPLLSWRTTETEQRWTFAPFLSYHTDSATDFTEFDLLYPLLTYDRFGAERRLQVLQLLSFAGSETTESEIKKRFTLFPFFFHQSSSHPASAYTAVVPFYGHLRNRVFRDDVRFFMLPLYLRTQKRDVVTENYLAPFFHRRHGNQLTGWQFWPLAGHEQKNPTSITNVVDETETVGGHDKTFLFWPFYFNNHLGVGTTNPQSQHVLLPFFSRQRSPLRDSSTFLWPFGLTHTDDREKHYQEWGAPWPLVTLARGPGKTANRIWPLFGRARNETLESDFYLWPLYKYNRATAAPLDRERRRILLFLYSDLVEKNTATGTAFHRTDLWPLFTARRDHDGRESLQFLSVLEPLLPNGKSIERNFSPAWALWRTDKDPTTGRAQQSALWNLFRRETTPTTRKGSLLFGLFRYESSPQGRRWRVLGLPLGKNSKTPPPPPRSP